MDRQSITLRHANPTIEDGLAFARYADMASEGFMRIMLGNQFAQIIASAFIEKNHDLSFQHVVFAQHDGVIVGMALSYSAEQHRQSSRQPLRHAAGRLRLRMRSVELFLAPLIRIVDSIREGDHYLQFIAVDRSLQSKGVGSLLMNHYEEQARVNGSTRLSLDVSKNNDKARRFYQGSGWNVESEWPELWVIPTLIYRMTKLL